MCQPVMAKILSKAYEAGHLILNWLPFKGAKGNLWWLCDNLLAPLDRHLKLSAPWGPQVFENLHNN